MFFYIIVIYLLFRLIIIDFLKIRQLMRLRRLSDDVFNLDDNSIKFNNFIRGIYEKDNN